MTYLLWPQDQEQKLLDLNDANNFQFFVRQIVSFVRHKPLVVTEDFYHILNQYLPVETISKFNFKYILTSNLSFMVPQASTFDKPEKIIADFPKFVNEDLYVIGDKNTISSFFSHADYLIIFTFKCQNSKIIEKIDCINFANHILLDQKNVSSDCLCSFYCRQKNN